MSLKSALEFKRAPGHYIERLISSSVCPRSVARRLTVLSQSIHCELTCGLTLIPTFTPRVDRRLYAPVDRCLCAPVDRCLGDPTVPSLQRRVFPRFNSELTLASTTSSYAGSWLEGGLEG
ncbi:hypothetical protein K523DRAFT_141582 [Schizophyllum commune Tattone D]|nr:hypothetical protein K523DRAFT_141582 [Schizophyllum commune Tattone D]